MAGKGKTIKYGNSSYKNARNMKGGKSSSSKGAGTLRKGGRLKAK